MTATFEEKTYENYFNIELASRSKVVYPIGQAQEGFLGFDSSAFSRHSALWHFFKHPLWPISPLRGVELRTIARDMEDYLSVVIDNIPVNLKVNLLFQYKRPEIITRSSGKEWRHWRRNYFRYEVYQRQQELLENIDSQVGSKVLTLYACPAFHDHNDLVSAHISRSIINNSNFTRASDLAGHHYNTFTDPGTISMAFSEPEPIKSVNIVETINSFSDSQQRNSEENNRNFIINFSKQIESVTLQGSSYSDAFRQLRDTVDNITNYQLFYSFITMYNFRQVTGLQWLITY